MQALLMGAGFCGCPESLTHRGMAHEGRFAKTEGKRGTRANVLALVEGPGKRDRSANYSPEACDHVIALMKTGLSLTAAAGAMGVARSTLTEWIKAHPEFSRAVEIGKAQRVWALETKMLQSDSAALTKACLSALAKAAPDEWDEKHVNHDAQSEDPIRLLAKQLMGTALRPSPQAGNPEAKLIEPAKHQMELEPGEPEDDELRIHTVSRRTIEDTGEGEA